MYTRTQTAGQTRTTTAGATPAAPQAVRISAPHKGASTVEAAARERLTQLMDGYLRTQLLRVAAHLGIADALAAGPLTSDEIAQAVGAEADALRRVLRGLVLDGVLSEQEDGRFGLTPAGTLLRTDVPGSLRGSVIVRGDIYYSAAAGLLHAVRRGGSAFEYVYGVELFEYLAGHPDEEAEFQRSMAGRAQQEAADVVAAYDFGAFRRLVDVGGGPGTLLSAILQATPALHGVLFDRPRVTEQARAHLAAAGLPERCSVVGGDFFRSVPAGGDVYLLSRVIHDWDDAQARQILSHCRAAMPEDGTLLLVEAVLPERACERPGAVRMDLHMLTLLRGRERTAVEYQALLAACGFALTRIVPTPSPAGLCVLEASPR